MVQLGMGRFHLSLGGNGMISICVEMNVCLFFYR